MTDNTNPGNFANRPKEEVSSIAQRGGQASHTGGFASMDPDKQVNNLTENWCYDAHNLPLTEGYRFPGWSGIFRIV